MGGFHLFQRSSREAKDNYLAVLHEDDTPLHPLQSFHFFSKHEDQTDIDIDFTSFTVPTEEEIKDRGKSDWLAKSLVLLQTSWFVIQSIARAKEHLPITHLEIVTLAYAAMNFVIYIFWWSKPLNVNRPVRVFRKSGLRAESESRETQHSSARGLTWEEIRGVLKRIAIFIGSLQDKDVNLSSEDRVPRFWANSSTNDAANADYIVLGVGVCFGAIHCISWDYSFPTHTELLMWRVSCVAITAVPIYIPLGIFLGNRDWFTSWVTAFFSSSGVMVFIVARAITLILAFTSLRDLPPGAYQTVHWTTFIPHV